MRCHQFSKIGDSWSGDPRTVRYTAAAVEPSALYRLRRNEPTFFEPLERMMSKLGHRVVLRAAVDCASSDEQVVAGGGDGAVDGALAQLRGAVDAGWSGRPRRTLCRQAGVSPHVLYRLLRGERIRVAWAERLAREVGLVFALVPAERPN